MLKISRGGAVGGPLIALLVAAIGACGTPVPVATPPSTSSPTPTPTSSTSSTSVPTVRPSVLGFSDADDGRVVTVEVGERVTVILHSSDFVFTVPSDPSVLRHEGAPTVTPGGPACTDTAGAGCGTVVAEFVALAPGNVTIEADRTNCDEPGCSPEAAHWEILLQVVAVAPTDSPSSTSPSGPPTTPPSPPDQQAEVRGTVRFSPVCPVERIPPDPACAPRPGPADIELVRPDGTVAATARAGADGVFTIAVTPGAYTVRAAANGPALGGACQVDPAEVIVEPGTSNTVAVSCDTGIR